MMIRVFDNTSQLSAAAADLFVQTARTAVEEQGRFTVALTGGSSPEQLYRLLAQPPYRDQMPWPQTYIFWGDERWVPLSDDRSNAKMAFELLINHVPVPVNQIYPMWGTESPETFAQQYEDHLRQHFGEAEPRFDLIFLGMGDDGHTASLFPGTEVLQEKTQWVKAYFLEPQEMYRITLTAPFINQAKKIIFLTFGEKKASALYEILKGEPNPDKYPSQLIKPQTGEVIWLIDQAANRLLAESL
jgi:6-phosphogluconolactonase